MGEIGWPQGQAPLLASCLEATCVAIVPRAGLCALQCWCIRELLGQLAGTQGPRETKKGRGSESDLHVVQNLQTVDCRGGGPAAKGGCEAARKLLQKPG